MTDFDSRLIPKSGFLRRGAHRGFLPFPERLDRGARISVSPTLPSLSRTLRSASLRSLEGEKDLPDLSLFPPLLHGKIAVHSPYQRTNRKPGVGNVSAQPCQTFHERKLFPLRPHPPKERNVRRDGCALPASYSAVLAAPEKQAGTAPFPTRPPQPGTFRPSAPFGLLQGKVRTGTAMLHRQPMRSPHEPPRNTTCFFPERFTARAGAPCRPPRKTGRRNS